MARNNARGGRRRRVLNEEVLSASNIAVRSAPSSEPIEPGDTPRYGAGANIENHPQVTSFVPRRFRTLCLIALGGLTVSVAAELTAHHALSLSNLTQVVSPEEVTEVFANRLVAWTSALLLLLTAGYTRLIFLLRRHRVDDYRGRYRVWRTVGWVAVGLSLNAVLGVHQLAARCLGNLVDWQLLPASAGWWLAPAILVGGWLALKMIGEATECRSALVVYLLALSCLTIAGVHSAGWSPAFLADWPGLISRSLPLLGYTFLLVGSLLFARYVILDVQGLIEHAAMATASRTGHEEKTSKQQVSKQQVEAAGSPARAIASDQSASSSDWVDGSQPESDYDEQPNRRLSKSDRKRLRKQKQRGRAA